MATMKIKKGDTVKVIAGKDTGKEGKVLVVDQKNAKVVVEGVNMITKHQKQISLFAHFSYPENPIPCR